MATRLLLPFPEPPNFPALSLFRAGVLSRPRQTNGKKKRFGAKAWRPEREIGRRIDTRQNPTEDGPRAKNRILRFSRKALHTEETQETWAAAPLN